MKVSLGLALVAGIGLSLVPHGAWAAAVPDKAKAACLTAVNGNYGGMVGDVVVASSEFSQANSTVIVKAVRVRGTSQNEMWKCLVSNGGKVQDLSVMPSSGSSSRPTSSSVSEAAKSACMQAVNSQYGGNVRDLKVTRSEFSQANSEVIIKAIGVRGGSSNENWRCLVSNSGKVQDLSVLGN